MKKLLAFTLTVASIAILALPVGAKATKSSNSPKVNYAPQVRVQFGPNTRYNHRVRVVTRTRFVHIGRRVYRETYQVRYLPNGRTQTVLISRFRIR